MSKDEILIFLQNADENHPFLVRLKNGNVIYAIKKNETIFRTAYHQNYESDEEYPSIIKLDDIVECIKNEK